MSSDNVALVHRAYERFNSGDIDGFLELCSPELEFRDIAELPGSGVFVGHDAVRGWWAQLYDAFDDLRFDAKELVDAGDHVLALSQASGCGRSSGAPVEFEFTNVWTVKDGRVSSCISYSDHAEALVAAGVQG